MHSKYHMIHKEHFWYAFNATRRLCDRLDIITRQKQINGGLELSRSTDSGKRGGSEWVALDLSDNETWEMPTMNTADTLSKKTGDWSEGEHAEEGGEAVEDQVQIYAVPSLSRSWNWFHFARETGSELGFRNRNRNSDPYLLLD